MNFLEEKVTKFSHNETIFAETIFPMRREVSINRKSGSIGRIDRSTRSLLVIKHILKDQPLDIVIISVTNWLSLFSRLRSRMMNTWIIVVPLHLYPPSTFTPPPFVCRAHGLRSFHAPYISRSKRERATYHIGVQLTETFGCIKRPKVLLFSLLLLLSALSQLAIFPIVARSERKRNDR